MQSDFKTELRQVQHQYLLDAGGGVSLPVAGAIYWIVLAVLAGQMEVAQWAFWAAALSGAIFPLGLLLQKPLRSPFMKSKSPLSGVVMLAIFGINALWPLHFLIMGAMPEATVLSLAIGMSLHWPLIGWAYGSRVCIIHGAARVIAATVLFFALPELRLEAVPLAMAALYLAAAAGIRWEIGRIRRNRGAGETVQVMGVA
ncbi:DUF7010 family protein [Maricaulis sp. CAU 1757]